MSGPDYLNPNTFIPMIRMIYEQCLCCFLYNAEVWISYAYFEQHKYDIMISANINTSHLQQQNQQQQQQQQNQINKDNNNLINNNKVNINDSRQVLLHAIENNPSIIYLRINLSELEEIDHNLEASKEILRVTFEQIPNGFTFSLYQKFLRRNLGIIASRKLFKETINLRKYQPKIGFEIYLSHAKLELEVNCNPKIAYNILLLTRIKYPTCIYDIYYIKSLVKVLLQLGDLLQLRWIFQIALHESNINDSNSINNDTGGGNDNNSSNLMNNIVTTSSSSNNKYNNIINSTENIILQLRTEYELRDEYLKAEIQLGMSDVIRLNELRNRRDKVKIALNDAMRIQFGIGSSSNNNSSSISNCHLQHGFFMITNDLIERYDQNNDLITYTLTDDDQDMIDRSRQALKSSFSSPPPSSSSSSILSSTTAMNGITGTSISSLKRDLKIMSTKFNQSLSGLPMILRDLLSKLPTHIGPVPDIDGFIRHMKSMILPPRPSIDDNIMMIDVNDVSSSSSSSGGYMKSNADNNMIVNNEDKIPAWLIQSTNQLVDDIIMSDEPQQQQHQLQQVELVNGSIVDAANFTSSSGSGGVDYDNSNDIDDDVFRKRQKKLRSK